MDLNDPMAVALATAEALGKAGIEAALYGGLVLAAYGEPRETKDADMAVAGASAGEALEALRGVGFDAYESSPERVAGRRPLSGHRRGP